MASTQCTTLPVDSSAHAAASNDQTIEFQGGGAVSQKGYLFFQKSEGTLPSDPIALIVPGTDCKRDSCVRFQFFRKDGSAGFGEGVKKGQTQIKFLLSDIVGHASAVTAADNGEYSAVVQVYYLDALGYEQSFLMNGFIRLNVLSAGYLPVGCGDPARAWRVSAGKDCEAQFTTAGRSVACGAGCGK